MTSTFTPNELAISSTLPDQPSTRLTSHRLLTLLIACSCLAVSAAGCTSTEAKAQELAPGETRLDVDQLCKAIEERYFYFEERKVHWPEACSQARAAAEAVNTRKGALAVLESLLDQLYDPHVSFGTATQTSPRLIPSGTDLWIEVTEGRHVVAAVKASSPAAKWLRVGDEVLAFNGQSLKEATTRRIKAGSKAVSKERYTWAVNATLAGYRNEPRTLTVLRGNGEFVISLENNDVPPTELVTPKKLQVSGGSNHTAPELGYIRFNNSLGDAGTVKAFDAAVEALSPVSGWILDLRNTPGGGGTDVAEPILGRFLTHVAPYQLVEQPRGTHIERRVQPRASHLAQPLTVLVGRWTGSMGEGMAIGLDGLKRAQIIGSQMAGLAGGIESESLRHTQVDARFPTYGLSHVDGTQRHRWTLQKPLVADNGNQDDLALEAARNWLQSQMENQTEPRPNP